MESDILLQFRQRVSDELVKNIIPFWLSHTPDYEHGGIYGRITNQLIIEKEAPKSLILTSRVLWTFARLYQFRQDESFLDLARHTHRFLVDKFLDREYGGACWVVSHQGHVIDDKKKIYGQAFTMYALAQYFLATGDPTVLDDARYLFQLVEKHNYDPEHGGYFETANRDWSRAEEMRLSEVDMNEVKSMNTHLHMMEAYFTLYRAWPDKLLKERLGALVSHFCEHIINRDTRHFNMFFDETWNSRSRTISYGHDIEGSWLLCEAAEALDQPGLISDISRIATQLLDTAIDEAFSQQGAIFTEKSDDGTLYRHTDWWQQAEAVVGFLNGYQVSGDRKYMEWAMKCWEYIAEHIVDHTHGEWYYMVDAQGHPAQHKYKVSEWKGPYHNGRACIEVITRLDKLINNQEGEHGPKKF
jgi:mannobiose 2-epimerase